MRDARDTPNRRPAGFTLTELLVVIAIIGILVTFILVASRDGVRRAQEKATQSLIAKLESGVAERLDAILVRRADVTLGHHFLAATFNSNFPPSSDSIVVGVQDVNGNITTPGLVQVFGASNRCLISPQRAQAIAQFDLVRAELPDSFLVMTTSPSSQAPYPINFLGAPAPFVSSSSSALAPYLLPIGSSTSTNVGDPNATIGIYGASYQAASGIYKQLGYVPNGYDGVDNNGDGVVDDWTEGTTSNTPVTDPNNPGVTMTVAQLVSQRLAAHTQITARSEMLYALLVEGVGPLGSVFNRDDFTQREVMDTDGDGLLEFVDAWGQPLQFYRWPIYYNNLNYPILNGVIPPTPLGTGSIQKGMDLYSGVSETRQLDPLDPNQSLTSPAWWSSTVNSVPSSNQAYSSAATTFGQLFHSIYDPNVSNPNLQPGQLWDRGGALPSRRAFYSRYLILSAGPDGVPGVARLFSANESPGSMGALFGVKDGSGGAVPLNVTNLIQIENQAAAIDPVRTGGMLEQPLSYPSPNSPVPGYSPNETTSALQIAGQDDITNQGLATPGGGVR